jgi:hypothetical protein
MANEDAERDIERAALLLRQRSLERLSQNLHLLLAEAFEQGEKRSPDYDQALLNLPQDLLRVQRALSRRTSMARREEREKAL